MIFLIGEKSADKSLKIRPGSSRGAPGNVRFTYTDAEPGARRGKGEVKDVNIRSE